MVFKSHARIFIQVTTSEDCNLRLLPSATGYRISCVCHPIFPWFGLLSSSVLLEFHLEFLQSVKGRFLSDVFLRWSLAPVAGDGARHFNGSLIEMTFPGRHTNCVQLCGLNKQELKSDPCSYRLAAFERCARAGLTAAKCNLVWAKLVLLFRAAFWVFTCWPFWLRVNLFQTPYSSACQAQTWWE